MPDNDGLITELEYVRELFTEVSLGICTPVAYEFDLQGRQ